MLDTIISFYRSDILSFNPHTWDVYHPMIEHWGTNRLRNLLKNTLYLVVSDPGLQPRVTDGEQDFSVILVPVFHAVSSILHVLPCGPYFHLHFHGSPYSYHYFRLTPSQERDVLLSLRELRQLSKGPIWETVRRARCLLYIPGMPAGPWNVVELWYERGSEAPSFLSIGLQPGDLWYLQGLPEFPLLPIGLSQEMASSFNLLLNSTLFGRKSLTFVVCVW